MPIISTESLNHVPTHFYFSMFQIVACLQQIVYRSIIFVLWRLLWNLSLGVFKWCWNYLSYIDFIAFINKIAPQLFPLRNLHRKYGDHPNQLIAFARAKIVFPTKQARSSNPIKAHTRELVRNNWSDCVKSSDRIGSGIGPLNYGSCIIKYWGTTLIILQTCPCDDLFQWITTPVTG